MLVARALLFAVFQAAIAIAAAAAGAPAAWDASTAWWPITATLANVACIALLIRQFGREGLRYRDLFRTNRATWKGDLLAMLGVLLVSGPVAFLPNLWAAQWLFGGSEGALALFIQPLPLWAALASLGLFPITMALAELPTYFGYTMPRLEPRIGRWPAVLACGAMLAAQHATLPLIWSVPFMAWRLLMFLPFALMIGIVLHWRPQLMPYLVIVHGLMDLATAGMVWSASL